MEVMRMNNVLQLVVDNPIITQFYKVINNQNTIRAYSQTYRSFFKVESVDQITSLMIKSINSNDVQMYINQMVNENKSRNTILRNINALRSLYNYLLEEEIININPFIGKNISRLLKSKLPEEKEVGIALSKREINQIINSIPGKYDKILISFMLHTALRASEVTNVCWNDFSYQEIYDKWFLTVIGKGNKERVLEIPSKIIDDLNNCFAMMYGSMGTSNYKLFDMNTSTINRKLKKYCALAGIREINPHDTRRTVITHLHLKGVSTDKIMNFVGHKRWETTQKYIKQVDKYVNNAGGEIDW